MRMILFIAVMSVQNVVGDFNRFQLQKVFRFMKKIITNIQNICILIDRAEHNINRIDLLDVIFDKNENIRFPRRETIWLFNDNSRGKAVLFGSVQGIAGWLLLIFFVCSHKQLSSIHMTVKSIYVWKMWLSK